MNTQLFPPKGVHQLRWKLTISYAAVTVGTLLTVELVFISALGLLLVFLLNSGFLQRQLIETAASSYSPALRFFLEQTPPNQIGINAWLANISTASNPTLPFSFDATDAMFVVGQDGRLLGAAPADLLGPGQIGQPLQTQANPELAALVQSAMAGTEEIEELYTIAKPGETILMAMPLWDEHQEEVLGVWVAMVAAPTLTSFIGEALPVLGISLLLFTFSAALIGTIYGFLAARKPVQRLNQLAEASLSWSQGDFTMFVDDPTQDELGQLAYHLNSMAQQLDQLLETRHELAILEERNRLARDLHDSVKQQAFAAAAQVSGARALLQRDPQAAETPLLEAEHLIYNLRQELTVLIFELRPTALAGKGLATAVRDYAADWSQQNKIMSEVHVRGERMLPLTIEQPLFRIVQEALANVARHSRAAQVIIDLTYTVDKIGLTIRDDGDGFAVDALPHGYGLISMQERATALAGTLTVESAAGQGSTIHCTVPVREGVNNHEENSDE